MIAALIVTASAGCGSSDEPVDPLDRELIRELSHAQGSASGSARSGSFALEASTDTCDCPSLDIDGQTLDLCTFVEVGSAVVQLTEGSGVLAIDSDLGLLTGAIETDDSFVVAGIQDLTTIAGPLESLYRVDGQFSSADAAAGWAGQRLLGELAGEIVDCRWIGSIVLTRN